MRRRTLVHLCIGLLCLVVACGDSSSPEPAEPTHDLVFEGYLSQTPELLTLDSGSNEVSRLLPAATAVIDPEPSPDGTRIAFVVANYSEATGDIYVMNRDGSGLVPVTNSPELDDQPSWSPDGMRIAFRSFRTGARGTSGSWTPTAGTRST